MKSTASSIGTPFPGAAKVAVLKSKKVAEDGSPIWDVLLQEALSKPRRKPETKEEAQPAAAPPYSAKAATR
jgi:hypothetical protein